jgi:hypothetical protein
MGVSVSAAIVRLTKTKAAGDVPAACAKTFGRAELTGYAPRNATTNAL